MNKLKAVHAFDVYEAYTKTGNDDAAQVYLKSEVDAAIAELNEIAEDACLERDDFQNVIDELEAENSRLKRALWLARAKLCNMLDVDKYLREHRNSWYNENCLTWHEACDAMGVEMCKAESKCRAKAEEYK